MAAFRAAFAFYNTSMSKPTYVYIDGFNLYYGAVINNPEYKWLDLVKFCESILPGENVKKIKYFTASILGLNDENAPRRQKIYWRALKELYPQKVEIIEGHFKKHPRKYYRVKKLRTGYKLLQEKVWVLRVEEKCTDVNLAVHLVNDAWKNLYNKALVISNDTDLEKAILISRKELKKKIIIANPYFWEGELPHKTLRDASSRHIRIYEGNLKDNQLPDQIPGTKIYRPPKWK